MPKMVHPELDEGRRVIDAHDLQVPVFRASGWQLIDDATEPAADSGPEQGADTAPGAEQSGTDSSAGASAAGGQQKPPPASRQRKES